MVDLDALFVANARRWASAKPTRDFELIAKRLAAPEAKARYQHVSGETSVPWPVIAVIHERECGQDWAGSLAQGDPWNKVSVHVPKGRGPFESWEAAAIDALSNCPPYAARNTDWSIGGTLTLLEQYNGLGYAERGQPSPYIWSGTDQYKSGKYVRDGVYDPDAVDRQPGCAGLLMAMMAIDSSIVFGRHEGPIVASETESRIPLPPVAKPSAPSLVNPSKGSIGAFVVSLFAALFRRK